VLFHHGTTEETAALVRAVPGFTVAFAARGDELARQEPLDAGGTPVFFPGRRLRFAWMVTLEGGRVTHSRLLRIGAEMFQRGSPIGGVLAEQATACRDVGFARNVAQKDNRPEHPLGVYVGASRCAQCHTEEFAAHGASRHALRPKGYRDEFLGQAGCLVCHMTGAFRRGGWKGKEDASDLGAVSCEACHGPGSEHIADTGKPYGPRGVSVCRTCHTPDRSPVFDAEALWKQWGHGPK
jgi:cytochrome c554/c'-like protein